MGSHSDSSSYARAMQLVKSIFFYFWPHRGPKKPLNARSSKASACMRACVPN